MLVITITIRHSLGLGNRSGSSSIFLVGSLSAKIAEDEEGATETSDKDDGDGNTGYSSCTYAMGAITSGLNDGTTARNWVGLCGTSTSAVDMRYRYDVAWYRRVESRL